jgi:hypothetical protein
MSKLTAQPVSTNFHQGHKKMHDFNKRLLSYKRLIKTALNFKNLSAKLTPSKNHFSKFKRHKLMMMLKKDSQIKFKNVSSAQIISLSLIPLLKSSKPNLKAIKSQFQVSQNQKNPHKLHLFITNPASILSKQIPTEESSANPPDPLH